MIVVDRLEGDLAILEVDGQAVDFPASALPDGARERSVLRLCLAPDEEETTLEEAQDRLRRLKKRTPPKGVLDL